MDDRHIRVDDGVFVHGWLIVHGQGAWLAYHDGSILYSPDRDELLLQVARATESDPDLGDLNGRLSRSIERAERRRAEDEAVRMAQHGKSTPRHGQVPQVWWHGPGASGSRHGHVPNV
jgi:hypothetical protein